jgi:hypothetical protein
MVLVFTVGVVTDVLPVIESVDMDVFVIVVAMFYPTKKPLNLL